MARWLAIASLVWLVVLGATIPVRASGHAAGWTTIVYVTASRVCHQRPERSFHSGGVQWPVCARCAGLYATAPFGAVLGVGLLRRRDRRTMFAWLAAASLPTAVTLALEWSGAAAMTNGARFAAALPLGAAIAAILVHAVADEPRKTIE